MADDSTPFQAPGAPGQQAMPEAANQLESGYQSPTYDLRVPAAPAVELHADPISRQIVPPSDRYGSGASAGERVQIGQETIQIAPHPTTNRFPWAPVDNPTVPIYGAVPEQPPVPEPSPLSEAPPPQPAPVPQPVPQPVPKPEPEVLELPAPPLPEPVPEPVPEPTPFPPPQSEPTPVPKPEPAPQPKPAPRPQPVVERRAPRVAAVQPPPPVAPAPESAPLASLPPAPRAQLKPQPHKGPRIYSEATRQVWHVLRPGRLITLLLIVGVVLAFVGGFVIWRLNGGSTDLSHLPFMQQLLQRK